MQREQPLSKGADRVEVALFPIPNVVAFPGTSVPLHVFEPRYRQLVNDCVRDHRMIAVSHVVKTIHEPRPNQSLEQALSSNQGTYKPRGVFCAGHCEIVETTSDGRIIVNIAMSERLSLVDEIQTLPYRIVACAPVLDVADEESSTENRRLQTLVNERIIELMEPHNAAMAAELTGPEWASLEPGDFSFKVFQFVRFDPDVMQAVLESQSANVRLEMIWELLK
jgi:Lon protease-like protein